jgi:hypothetical protein
MLEKDFGHSSSREHFRFDPTFFWIKLTAEELKIELVTKPQIT